MSARVTTAGRPQSPGHRGWTGEEFDRLAEMGFFGPDEHLELVDGRIIEKMTQNSPHATALRLTEKALNRIFTEGFDVRSQLPLALGKKDRPEPDVSVVPGSPRDYLRGHPTTALLVVEISDTTLLFDQSKKQGVYARAGIAEYWIVNLKERVLEVYRHPVVIDGFPLGHGYQKILRLTEHDTVSPLAAEGAVISVADLLP